MLFALQHISVVLQLHSIFLVLTSWHAKQKKKKKILPTTWPTLVSNRKELFDCITGAAPTVSIQNLWPLQNTCLQHALLVAIKDVNKPLQLHHRCCTVTVCTHNPDPHSAALFLSECKSADTWCGKIHWLWRRTEKSRARCITGAAHAVNFHLSQNIVAPCSVLQHFSLLTAKTLTTMLHENNLIDFWQVTDKSAAPASHWCCTLTVDSTSFTSTKHTCSALYLSLSKTPTIASSVNTTWVQHRCCTTFHSSLCRNQRTWPTLMSSR